jgi:hypothetical protein
MFSKINPLYLNTYDELIKIPTYGKMIKSKQLKFYNQYKVKKNVKKITTDNQENDSLKNEYYNYLFVRDENELEYFHKNDIFCVKINTNETNPHLPLASLRRYEENYIIIKVAFNKLTKKLERIVVDIAPTERTVSYCITKIAIKDELCTEDVLRMEKGNLQQNMFVVTLKMKLEEALESDYLKAILENYKDLVLFNLTDVLYYIDISTIIKMSEFFSNNVVFMVGTMHLFNFQKNNKIKIGSKIYGSVNQCGSKIQMEVSGNQASYEHALDYQQLINSNQMVVPVKDGYIIFQVEHRYDLGATQYISFLVMKTKYFQFKIDKNLIKANINNDLGEFIIDKSKATIGKNSYELITNNNKKLEVPNKIYRQIILELIKIKNNHSMLTESQILEIYTKVKIDLKYSDAIKFIKYLNDKEVRVYQ